mgnify:CR=1 FL=1|jgi:hypothetical protein
MTNHIRSGFKFTNEDMELTVILCDGIERKNVALLIQENTGCPFITVRDLSELKSGDYDWAWGHYFKSFNKALKDYNERRKDLLALQ